MTPPDYACSKTCATPCSTHPSTCDHPTPTNPSRPKLSEPSPNITTNSGDPRPAFTPTLGRDRGRCASVLHRRALRDRPWTIRGLSQP